MRRFQIMRIIVRHSLVLAFIFSTVLPGYAAELTQRDWMITLVDVLGWSYGLPDEPQDPDYINILAGNRQFHFEAEDIYARDEDNVSVMTFQNFGPFTGSGWLNGTREPTKVHLRFTLPISGEYELKGHLRLEGHEFTVGGTTKTADAMAEFSMITVGSFPLQAGAQEIVATLPANGSIDYITLTAPSLATITPDQGWNPDEPLTWQVMQTTLLQLFQLAELFPVKPSPIVIEAEALAQTEVQVVDIPHLGYPSGGKWLRSGPLPAEVRFPVKVRESGFYDLTLRAMGGPITVTVADQLQIDLATKGYLDDYVLKPLYFLAGTSDITLSLPPGGGVDLLSLTGRQVDNALANTLLGLGQHNQPTTQDLDALTALLAAFGIER